MQMPKASDDDKQRFRDLIAPLAAQSDAVEVKPMFGQLGAFVNGNMFMGLFGAQVGLKLDEGDRATLMAEGGGPFGPAERPMGGYVTLPEGWTPAQAEAWVATSLATVGALPTKKAKKK